MLCLLKKMNREIKETALNTEESVFRVNDSKNILPVLKRRGPGCVSGHCCDASGSTTELEAKIDKLPDLFTEIASLKVRLAEVEK